MPFVDDRALARISHRIRQAAATVVAPVAEAAHQAQSEIMREDGQAMRSFGDVAEVGGSAFAFGYANGKLGTTGNQYDPAGGQAFSVSGVPVDGLAAVAGLAATHFVAEKLGPHAHDVTMVAAGAFASFAARAGSTMGAKAAASAQTSGAQAGILRNLMPKNWGQPRLGAHPRRR